MQNAKCKIEETFCFTQKVLDGKETVTAVRFNFLPLLKYGDAEIT